MWGHNNTHHRLCRSPHFSSSAAKKTTPLSEVRRCRFPPSQILTGGEDAGGGAGVGAHDARLNDLGGAAVPGRQRRRVGGGAAGPAAGAALGHTAHVQGGRLHAGDAAGARLGACENK